MAHLLIINPNTSEHVTALILRHAQAAAGVGHHIEAVTARFGAPYISDEASYAIATHAALDAWTHWLQGAKLAGTPEVDGVLIACFGDPGLFALREVCPCPVSGLAEAAFEEAQNHGRFAVVTGGARWRPMLERLAAGLGINGNALVGIDTVEATGAQLAADPAAAHTLLVQACRAARERTGAQAIILGGAGLAGMAAPIAAELGFAVIDSVVAGTQRALRRAAARKTL